MDARRARVARDLQALREAAGPGVAGADFVVAQKGAGGDGGSEPWVVEVRRAQADTARSVELGSRERYLVLPERLAAGRGGALLRLDSVPEDARGASSLVLESRFEHAAAPASSGAESGHSLARSVRVRKGAKDDKELWLELWMPGHGLVKAVKLSEVASKIYNDAVFGGIRWSPEGDKVVFVAEIAQPKAYANAFNPEDAKKPAPLAEDKQEAKKKPFAESKYEYMDDFGETLEGNQRPGIFLWDLTKSDAVRQVACLPAGVVPTDPQFVGDGLIFSGVHAPLRKLGLNFCLNRTTRLYLIPRSAYETPGSGDTTSDTSGGAADASICLTPNLALAYGARVSSQSGRIVFYGRKEPFVSHTTCFELYAAELRGAELVNLRVVLNRRRERPDPGVSGHFAGLYGYHGSFRAADYLYGLDAKAETAPPRWFLLQSPSQGQNLIFLVDLESTDKVDAVPVALSGDKDAFAEGELTLLRVLGEFALVSHASTTSPGEVLLLRFTDRAQPLQGLTTVAVDDRMRSRPPAPLPRSIADDAPSCERLFSRELLREHRVSVPSGAEGYLSYVSDDSSGAEGGKLPCVVIIHGGPFSASPRDGFSLMKSFLHQQGVAVLVLNYRGSVGFGEDFLNALVGTIGDVDVHDCGQLVRRALEEHADVLDPKRVAVYGGSHGGFLTGWLAGHPDYKDLFCAAVLWNPVLNLNFNLVATDIPDWVLGSAEGKELEHGVTPERSRLLYERSPASVAANVSIPCLTLLGDSDLRVPPRQGVFFHHSLLERGIPSKLYVFPDSGHAIAPTEQNLNAVFVLLLFLHEHLLP